MNLFTFSLSEQDLLELNMIVLDKDAPEALAFLEKKVLSQLDAKQRKKMDVEGKLHL